MSVLIKHKIHDENLGDTPCKKRRVKNACVKGDTNTEYLENEETKSKKKNIRKNNPKFRLKATGQSACLSTPASSRIPLFLTDVQHLLLHSLLGNLNLSEPPRWYVLEKCDKISQTTCLILEGISLKQWENQDLEFKSTNTIFHDVVEILTPSVYNGSFVQELALVPLTEVEKESIIQKYGSMNLALEVRKDLNIMMKAVFPITNEEVSKSVNNGLDTFPRSQLILSAWQLIEDNYPVPLKGKLKHAYADYIMTKTEYEPVTDNSPMFGLDCEMCMTNAGSELTRVSIVNEKHETIYESLVKPYNNITDYLTRYSGITQLLMKDVTKRLEDVQNEIRKVLPPDAILVGQSLNIDLHALKMMHPYIIDTSCIYNFTGERTRKPKLKTLAREFLNEDIQCGNSGHCSVEDALACIKLVQLKLSKHLEFGDAVHTNRQKYKENLVRKAEAQYALSIFNHMIEQKKSSVIIGCDDITGEYHTYLTQAKESVSSQLKKAKPKRVKLKTVDDADEVISSLIEAVTVNNFAMGHLKFSNKYDIGNIDSWIQKLWDNLEPSTLFVVVLGGTEDENGVVMMKIKSS